MIHIEKIVIYRTEKYNLNFTVQKGDGNVKVWACFLASHVGNLEFIEDTMNASTYIDISKKNYVNVEKLSLQKKLQFYRSMKHIMSACNYYILT